MQVKKAKARQEQKGTAWKVQKGTEGQLQKVKTVREKGKSRQLE